MVAKLHLDLFMNGQRVGHVHVVPGVPLEVGREGAGCRIADPSMSRRHFVVVQHHDRVTLQDLDSSGGTFLNGHEVEGLATLADQDRIEAGDTTVVVTLEEGSPDHIDDTTWHVHETPPGYFVIGHLGLQREGDSRFAETVVCRQDEMGEAADLDAYAQRQFEQLKLLAADLAVTRHGPAAELDPLPSLLLRLAYTYQGTPVHQWHIYVQREQRVGIAIWTFEQPRSGEREQVRVFLDHLEFE